MRRSTLSITIMSLLAAALAAPAALGQWDGWPTQVKPAKPAAKRVPKAVQACGAGAQAAAIASRVSVSTGQKQKVGYAEPIEVAWTIPATSGAMPVYLVGAMADQVRFEGSYRLDSDGSLQSGPGFVALPVGARAPYGFTFAEDRARVIIPVNDTEIPRRGSLRIKPYAAGPISIEWAVVAVDRACKTTAERTGVKVVSRIGPIEVAAGAARIVVQDFVAPDLALELAAPEGSQRLQEVEISADGRYRLEIFPRRYRVFDRPSGAKLVDRSGVKPRFSPGSRFVAASIGDAEKTYPTNLEVFDLVAGKVVANLSGPIVAWSNGDALLMDATRAYQSVRLFNTLVDPVLDTSGTVASWPYFFPGCSTCDAWASSNLSIDWDRLTVLRADSGSPRAMGLIKLAAGTKVETTSFGDEEATPLETRLREIFGRPDVPVTTGWTGDATLLLTHVGRGYDGYSDDADGLTPSEAGRRSTLDFLAPRRLALADGRVLRAEDLRPAALARGALQPAPRLRARSLPLDDESVAGDLEKLGLRLSAGEPVAEIDIPLDRKPDEQDALVRSWPPSLKEEIIAADPSLASWFVASDFPDIVVAAWRFEVEGVHYLLLQHGQPAMTAAGAHDLRFDLLTLDGTHKGKLNKLEAISGLYSQFVGRDHTVARLSILNGAHLVVAVPGIGKAEIVTLHGKAASRVVELNEPTVLCGFYAAAPRDLLVQANCDGQMFVFEPARQPKPLLAGRVVDNELILYSPEGFYASTYEGAYFVHVAFPGLPGVYSFEQFAKALERRDVIQSILGGAPLDVMRPVLTLPPVIEASLADSRRGGGILVKAKSEVGLAAVELYEDGRLAERRSATGKASEVLFKTELRPHIRAVALVAVDVNGFKSRPFPLAAPPSASKSRNTLHVVAFGVDDYDQLAKLKGARHDAETLSSVLKASAPYYRDVAVTLRVDREVTPQAVMADLRAAVASAGADDTVLVFFAGHGGRTSDGRYFMAASSTDPARLAETAIDWKAASDLLGTAKARVIAIIDACHSGQTGAQAVANDGAVDSLAVTAQAPMVVLAASKGRQESYEAPSMAGGIFTQTLAQLIGAKRTTTDSDQDGVLEISELYRNLRKTVDTVTLGGQTPWLVRRNIVGDAPLF